MKDTIDFDLLDQIQCELEFTLVDSYKTLHFLFLNSSDVELVIEDASCKNWARMTRSRPFSRRGFILRERFRN